MIDIDKFDRLFGCYGTIRKHVLARLEHLRESKIIGKSIEAGVKLQWSGPDWREAFWDGNTIREALNVSWVEMEWSDSETLDCGVVVWDLKKDPSFKQCLRCYLFHRDSDVPKDLCRRCAGVMYSCYPDHPALQNQ